MTRPCLATPACVDRDRRRRARPRALLGVALALLLVACGKEPQDSSELEARIAALEKELQELKHPSVPETSPVAETSALMKPGDPRYFILRTDLGLLTVLIANVEPDASGSRVTLRFGNLTSASIEGLKGRVEWGALDPNGQVPPNDTHSREVVFSELLMGGYWTNTTIVLNGVSPSDLGFVKVSELSHRGLRLRKANYD